MRNPQETGQYAREVLPIVETAWQKADEAFSAADYAACLRQIEIIERMAGRPVPTGEEMTAHMLRVGADDLAGVVRAARRGATSHLPAEERLWRGNWQQAQTSLRQALEGLRASARQGEA